jgi:hypothetical protein
MERHQKVFDQEIVNMPGGEIEISVQVLRWSLRNIIAAPINTFHARANKKLKRKSANK